MESTSQIIIDSDFSILRYIFQSCWHVFLPYLSNLEIGKFDLILTDVSLRRLYFSLVDEFYLSNKIYDFKELDWILNNNISLTKCHLEFSTRGSFFFSMIFLHAIYNSYMRLPFYHDADSELSVFSRIAKVFPNLIEISGKNIDTEGLRALVRLKGSHLSSIQFDSIGTRDESLLDKSIDVLCKVSPTLKKFRIIDSGNDDITDAAVQSIVKYCPHIEVLSFHYWTAITDLSMTYLAQLSSLREITLSDCVQLTSAGVQGLIKANRKLKALILSEVCETDNGFPSGVVDGALLRCIGQHCPNLAELHMRIQVDNLVQLDLTAASFEAMLKGLSALEEFRISDFDGPNTIIRALGLYCPRLKHAYIESVGCTDDDFVSMCQGCPLIETLTLRFIENLTDISILALACSCRSLQQLYLCNNDHITDDSLCKLFTTCIHLTTVDLTGLPHITDRAVLTLLRHCPHLTSLELCDDRLTDYCIQAIPTYCPHIQSLNLNCFSTLTHETIVQVSRYCKQIHALKLHRCDKINNNTVIEVLTNCKHLTYIDVRSDALHITDEFKAQCNALIAKRCYRTLSLIYTPSSIHTTK